jgi:uncharacterized protein (DUF736 family)
MDYDKPYEVPPNSGSLFQNKSKAKENSPDYSGEVLIDVKTLVVENGVAKMRLAGWKKNSKSGSTFLSLKISPPMPQKASRPRADSFEDMEDDVPF